MVHDFVIRSLYSKKIKKTLPLSVPQMTFFITSAYTKENIPYKKKKIGSIIEKSPMNTIELALLKSKIFF